MAVLDERSYNAKKPHSLAKLNNERVVRWVIVDHYSAAFYSCYSQGSEDSATAIDMLIRAMCRRAVGDPFCGAPALLYTDPGPAYTSALMRGFLQRVGIRHETHTPGNARATGAVEANQNIIERGFEGRLRFYQAADLDDLNARLDSWRVMYNAEAVHTRHKQTRNGLWLTITEDQLRVPQSEESLRELVASEPVKAKVGGSLTITHAPKGYFSQEYSLRNIPGVTPGLEVRVSVNPFEAPAVNVTVSLPGREDALYTVSPVRKNDAGFPVDAPVIGESYKSHKDTAADRALKEIEKIAYGADSLEEAAAAKKRKERPFAHINIMADVEQARPHTYLPKRGSAMGAEPPRREIPPLSPFEAGKRLRPVLAAQGVEWTPAYLAGLKARYPDGVPVDVLDGIAESFLAEAEQAWRKTNLRLVSGGM